MMLHSLHFHYRKKSIFTQHDQIHRCARTQDTALRISLIIVVNAKIIVWLKIFVGVIGKLPVAVSFCSTLSFRLTLLLRLTRWNDASLHVLS